MATTLCLQGRKPHVKNGRAAYQLSAPSLMSLLWHKHKFLSSLRYWYLGSVSYSSSDFTLTDWTFHTTSTGPCPQWERKSFVKLRQCPCNWLKDSLPPWFIGRPMRHFSWKPYLSGWPAKVTSTRQGASVSDWKQSLSRCLCSFILCCCWAGLPGAEWSMCSLIVSTHNDNASLHAC